jgi:hypothetical protein
MNDDELFDRLRAHADDLEAARSGTLGQVLTAARVRSGSATVKRRKPALIGAATALVAVAIAGGAVWRYADQRDTIRVSASDPTNPLPGQDSAVTTRIEVPETIVSGSQVEGTIVIDNNTGADITIPACGPMWYIALTNTSHGPDMGFAEPCLPPLVIGVGQSRLPSAIATSFSGCVEAPNIGDNLQECVNGGAPPLPAGEYTAILVGNHKDPLPGIPTPASVTVRVVAPGSTMPTSTTTPNPGGVTARIEVPETIVSGTQAEAALVIDNNTGADITIPGCGPMWAIALTNASHAPDRVFALPCLAPLVVRLGQTRLPSVLMASFATCTNGPSNGDTTPTCVNAGPPPLPPGEYTAVLVGLGTEPLPGIPNPAPVTVRVVAAS